LQSDIPGVEVQHGGPPSGSQPSPVPRHVDGRRKHTPPTHFAEQHWLLTVQVPPAVTQIGLPHIPPLHPSEQHSLALSHGALSAWQYCEHSRAPVLGEGSHRPLQQSLRQSQGANGAAHLPPGRQ
jgi:hypothetical protein